MGLDTEFWRGRRVFLTGHTGFKGSWLVLWLAHLGAKVGGYSLAPPSDPNLFEISGARCAMSEHHTADVRAADTLRDAIIRFEPEIVCHMAAQSLVRAGYADPEGTYSTNVMGTIHVLEAARQTPSVCAVVIVTSDKCYANMETGHALQESDALGGRDPYSSSKACAELATAAFRASFTSEERLPRIASVRAGNVIGGGDWSADRLIPDCIRAFAAGAPALLRYPSAIRPWQHVLDPLRGYLMLAERLMAPDGNDFASAWNFGPDAGSEATVLEVANAVATMWGERAEVRIVPPAINFPEAHTLRLDPDKAHSELGWTAHWRLQRSLRETVDWYLAWRNGVDMSRYCRAQIEAYMCDT